MQHTSQFGTQSSQGEFLHDSGAYKQEQEKQEQERTKKNKQYDNDYDYYNDETSTNKHLQAPTSTYKHLQATLSYNKLQ